MHGSSGWCTPWRGASVIRVLRPALIVASALLAAGSAQAYPWPIKPFDRQHSIGGSFGDPRMVFERTLAHDALNGPGIFNFHTGVDIHAKPGTPVYAIRSGIVRVIDASAVAVSTPTGSQFQYYHLKLAVRDGQYVVAQLTVLGRITALAGHVHLSEVLGGRPVNPLAPGHLQPYQDHTRPHVRAIEFRDGRGRPVSPLGVRGRVDVLADAYDLPVPFAAFPFLNRPVAPAVISWRVTTPRGRVVLPERTPVDFRRLLPRNSSFWRIYGRGTYPNGPNFGGQFYKKTLGRYLYRLTPGMLDTRRLPDGPYVLSVTARDIRGNRSSLSQRFEVLNRGS
jgi:murein DD-endopeptidase MepM/ murein hydrolase activator NlpD